jgi:hypothetical protein
MTIEAVRKGKHADRATSREKQRGETFKVGRPYVEYGAVTVSFDTPVSGFDLRIHPGSFHAIIQAMMNAEPEETLRAFGAVLQAGVPEAKAHWYQGWPKNAADQLPPNMATKSVTSMD